MVYIHNPNYLGQTCLDDDCQTRVHLAYMQNHNHNTTLGSGKIGFAAYICKPTQLMQFLYDKATLKNKNFSISKHPLFV